MERAIYFDMDGTLADLYGQENWLDRLHSCDPTVYAEAEPMADMVALKSTLSILKEQGVVIGVISWLAMNSTPEYAKATRQAKRSWLNKHFGEKFFHEVHLVKYGTSKHRVAKIRKGILVDDNREICEKWEKYGGRAIKV